MSVHRVIRMCWGGRPRPPPLILTRVAPASRRLSGGRPALRIWAPQSGLQNQTSGHSLKPMPAQHMSKQNQRQRRRTGVSDPHKSVRPTLRLSDCNHCQAVCRQRQAQLAACDFPDFRRPRLNRVAQLLQLRLGGIDRRAHLFVRQVRDHHVPGPLGKWTHGAPRSDF